MQETDDKKRGACLGPVVEQAAHPLLRQRRHGRTAATHACRMQEEMHRVEEERRQKKPNKPRGKGPPSV
jgi:hypothetical protein